MDSNSSAPRRLKPSSLPNRQPALSNDAQASIDEATHLKNRIHNVKLGQDAVQLNLSNTAGLAWDLEDHDIGDSGFHCTTNLSDETNQALIAVLHRKFGKGEGNGRGKDDGRDGVEGEDEEDDQSKPEGSPVASSSVGRTDGDRAF